MNEIVSLTVFSGHCPVAQSKSGVSRRIGRIGPDDRVTNSQLGLDCFHSIVNVRVLLGNLGIGMNFSADAMYYTPTIWSMVMGTATLYDASAGIIDYGVVAGANNATIMQIFSQASNGTYLARGLVNGSTPFTWAVSDEIKWNVYFKKA